MTDTVSDDTKTRLLEAALPHVAFDGWSETTFRAAAADADIDLATARAICPRGAVDLALTFHQRGDDAMVARLAKTDLSAMRYSEKVAAAIRFWIDAIDDREAVRRGMTLFALPNNAADGARAVWGTADRIWTALGDSSDDINWYTKRATLSGVYGSVVLYWLGDTSPGSADTWSFLDRRIDGVMQFEKLKARAMDNALLKPLLAGPTWIGSLIKPPSQGPRGDLPGMMTPRGPARQ